MEVTEARDPEGAVYAVQARVISGQGADPVLGDGLYCSVECANVGVLMLTRSISGSRSGAALVVGEGRSVGYVVTGDGRIWRVCALPADELLTEG